MKMANMLMNLTRLSVGRTSTLESLKALERSVCRTGVSTAILTEPRQFSTNPYFAGGTPSLSSLREMKNPSDILSTYASSSDANVGFLEAVVRALGHCRVRGSELDSLVCDERFVQLLSGLKGRLMDMDTRSLSMLVNGLALFSKVTPEMADLAQQIADVATRRENTFHPRALSSMVAALPRLGVRDPAVVEFFRLEAVKILADATPIDLHAMLDGFRHWGAASRELVDMVCEKMSDEIDRYTSKDVCDTLELLSGMGLARGFLTRRLSSLAFENLNQFTTRRLVSLLESLSRLRFLSPDNYIDVLDIIKQNSGELYGPYIARLCNALSLGNCTEHEAFVKKLVLQSAESNLGPESTVVLAHTMLYFQLKGCDDYLKALLARALDLPPEKLGQQEISQKMIEIVNAVELELDHLGVVVPPSVVSILDERERRQFERLELSRVHTEIDSILCSMKGKYQLSFQRSLKAGPYRVELLDEETKIIVELDILTKKTNSVMKMRHLEKLGYRPTLIPFWQWRRCRTEADQVMLLKQALEPHLSVIGGSGASAKESAEDSL